MSSYRLSFDEYEANLSSFLSCSSGVCGCYITRYPSFLAPRDVADSSLITICFAYGLTLLNERMISFVNWFAIIFSITAQTNDKKYAERNFEMGNICSFATILKIVS